MSTGSTSSLAIEPLFQSLQFKNGSLLRPTTAGRNDESASGDLSFSVSGHGVFHWTSGLQYTGEYAERKRHGYGEQLWPDGAKYEGHFSEDLRHGTGKHSWQNGEVYEGEYEGDKKHGCGVYRWPSGAYISGQFKLDCKEGHCVYVSAEGERFEGVYHCDIRNGEGVQTYPSGKQDVGSWRGTKLVRLRFAVREASFDPSSHGKSPDSSLGSPDVKQRGRYGPKGPLEVASEELIQAAANGGVTKVTAILKTGAVHVDVVDSNGHSALFAAAIHNHPDVINVLLDNGADVNKLDYIGVSALNACHHILYSSLPQMQALLKLLPPLKPLLSQGTPPHSTTLTALTDCTLHTSDFFSTPHTCGAHSNITQSPSSSQSECSECQGVCGAHPSHKQTHNHPLKQNWEIVHNLHKVHSYPMIPDSDQPKKVQFSSLNSLLTEDNIRPVSVEPLRSDNRPNPLLSGTKGSHSIAHQLALVSTKDVPILKQSLATGDLKTYSSNPLLQSPITPSKTSSTTEMSARDGSNLSNVFTSSLDESGFSVTASVNGDILGVSALSPDFYSSNKAGYRESIEANSTHECVSLPSQCSTSAQESHSDDGASSVDTESHCDNNIATPPSNHTQTQTLQVPFPTERNITHQHCGLSPTQGIALQLPCSSQDLHSSSVFSSTHYGPIVSAAQSTTLSYDSGSFEGNSTVSDNSSGGELKLSRSSPLTADVSISLLLQRGADPNLSQLPLPPLVYAIRSGDLLAVDKLLERGADVNQSLPPEVGGHSPLIEAVSLVGPNPTSIVESLLKHGASVNPIPHVEDSMRLTDNKTPVEGHESRPSLSTFKGLSSDKQPDTHTMVESNGCSSVQNHTEGLVLKEVEKQESSEEKVVLVAGDNRGLSKYTPLHVVCSHRATSEKQHKNLSVVVLAIVDLLLGGGATVNVVAMGHSPLSLAIINGHDTVVEKLLAHGAEPNLPLGRGVGTALCAITTHSALKKRDGTTSISMVGQLLWHGADFLQPVKVTAKQDPGTVADFAHAAFKEDKRLSCLKYSALSKTERARFRDWKKLVHHFVHLFRCKATQTIALKEQSWQKVNIDRPTEGNLPVKKGRIVRALSAVHYKNPSTFNAKRFRDIKSAGESPRSKGVLPQTLPEHSLMIALTKVTKYHGPCLSGTASSVEDQESESNNESSGSLWKSQEMKMSQSETKLKEMFDQALALFSNSDHTDDQKDTIEKQNEHNSTTESTGKQTNGHQSGTSTVHSAKITKNSASKPEWTLSSFCYECGRSSGVHLVKCFGCQSVSYCSRTCRTESFKKSHKEECTGVQIKEQTLSSKAASFLDSSSLKTVTKQRYSLV